MYMKQFLILLTALFAGYIASEGFGLPLPSNVIGLLLLLLALITGLVKLKDVEDTADFIIKHLALFFVAPTVGLMLYFNLIGESFLQITLPLFGSIIVGFFVAGKVTQLAIYFQIQWKKRRRM